MTLTLLLALSCSLGPMAAHSTEPMAADTTWSVRSGDRLSLEEFSGSLRVETWNRDEVEIETRGIDRMRFAVRSGGNEFQVRPSTRRGRERSLGYVVRIPTWLPLEVRGNELSIVVADHSGGLVLSTVEGDVLVDEVAGEILVRSLDGTITVNNAEGLIELFSLDDDVWVTGARGELHVNANDGDVVLREIDADVVEASTVDGDIDFSGTLHPQGRYTLVTHDGDLTLGILGEPNAHMIVSTYEGELESEFPIMLSRMESGREFDFTLGEGAAEVRLEAFDGDVRIIQARASTSRRRDGGSRDN